MKYKNPMYWRNLTAKFIFNKVKIIAITLLLQQNPIKEDLSG